MKQSIFHPRFKSRISSYTLGKSSILKTEFNSPFRKYEYVKVPFGLAQAPAYFQELMTGILKDFNFGIAYLDNIIIFSRMTEEHLSHIKKGFEKLQSAKLSMKLSKCHSFSKEIQYLGNIYALKAFANCLQIHRLSRRCIHQHLLNKSMHFLA